MILKSIVKIIEESDKETWNNIFEYILQTVPGVYNVKVSTDKNLYAFKDKYNVRPLCVGQNKSGICITSESIALGNYKYLREIEGGELIEISNNNIISSKVLTSKYNICLFEYIYFLNPNSVMNDTDIYSIRHMLGYK